MHFLSQAKNPECDVSDNLERTWCHSSRNAKQNLIDFREGFERHVDQFLGAFLREIRLSHEEVQENRVDCTDFGCIFRFAIVRFPPLVFPVARRNTVNIRVIVEDRHGVHLIEIIVQRQSIYRMLPEIDHMDSFSSMSKLVPLTVTCQSLLLD